MRVRSWILLISLLAIGASDAVFKAWALQFLPSDQQASLKTFLTLAVHRNPGIAFGIPLPLVIVLPITAVLLGVLGYVALKHWKSHTNQALCAIAAFIGALNNGIDRLINGFTTDYLIFFKTSAVNLSDVLILMGILGILWYDKHIPNSEPSTPETRN